MKQKLTIGILIPPDYCLESWEVLLIENVIEKNICEEIYFIVSELIVETKKPFLVKQFIQFENLWFKKVEDASKLINIRKVFNNHKIKYRSVSDSMNDLNLDIIYKSKRVKFNNHHIAYAKNGLWEIVFGEDTYQQSDLPAFWEVMNNSSVIGSAMIVHQKEKQPVLAYQCSTQAVPFSVKNTYNSVAWKSASFLALRLDELVKNGNQHFFEHYQQNKHTDIKQLSIPGNWQMLFLYIRNIFRYIFYKIRVKLAEKRFTILYSTQPYDIFNSDFSDFTPIQLPAKTFYADPFILKKNNQVYIFFEEYADEKGKGHLSVFTIDQNGNIQSKKIILEKEYHLSYPFVFEWMDEVWMIPETASVKNVQLYKAVDFPDKWVFVKNLMTNIELIDATLLFHNQKCWLFGTSQLNLNTSTNDQLFIYYADDLLATEWKPHPQNPVATNIANCRPAGKVFEHNGKLYRPAQNNASFQYGFGICINEIEILTEYDYREKLVKEFKPGLNIPFKAFHTINTEANFTVIDAVL